MCGYHENHGYQAYHEGDSYYKVEQSCWNRNEGMGRDFQESYESYKGSRRSETRKTLVQKKVRFEDKSKDVGDMCNEEKEKKSSMGKPCDHLCKKSDNGENTRVQQVTLDKNDTCEEKERHERRERVEEKVRISEDNCFLGSISSLFEKLREMRVKSQ
ncbi:hypothetical protein M9H77_18613 [Catharanthus roseus]|uniref:Uncharacterized protein n=1 Tax=Catharanthus roseus TaxID=4058 RepID=A0ACC0B7Y7_CATRO|nr:hypothetical protein M9H77_18613 [Catharanthus roseus]